MSGPVSGSWYLRSIGDRDTHRGELQPNGIVRSACGVSFQPRTLPYGRLALPGPPQDPDQICPQCRDGRPADRSSEP